MDYRELAMDAQKMIDRIQEAHQAYVRDLNQVMFRDRLPNVVSPYRRDRESKGPVLYGSHVGDEVAGMLVLGGMYLGEEVRGVADSRGGLAFAVYSHGRVCTTEIELWNVNVIEVSIVIAELDREVLPQAIAWVKGGEPETDDEKRIDSLESLHKNEHRGGVLASVRVTRRREGPLGLASLEDLRYAVIRAILPIEKEMIPYADPVLAWFAERAS